MFGLFKKSCPVCHMRVSKDKSIVRDGKYFCDEEHAEEYSKKMSKEESKAANHGGGCCGK